jgi:hypothetical protein
LSDVIDKDLTGHWSERDLDPHSVELGEVAFRSDGTGWLYWSSWSKSFSLHRFTWQVPGPGRVDVHFGHYFAGTWHPDDTHEVETDELDERVLELSYTIKPASGDIGPVLEFDQRLDAWTAGNRFALTDSPLDDPTA